MSNKIKVKKRNGKLEDFKVEKIHKVLDWATSGFPATSVSEIEIAANLSIYNGITTEEIHNLLIKSANNLISENVPTYQYVAARLLLLWVRKMVWKGPDAPRLYDHIIKNIDRKVYDNYILEKYTESEIHKIGKFINHDLDDNYTYAGLQQLVDKYICQNRETFELYETPQFIWIMVAMTLFAEYPPETRMQYIKKCYNYISLKKISLPTPILAGCRTNVRQYASCCLVEVEDTMSSIFSSATAISYYASRKAGIGVGVGRIRNIGSPIRNGETIHTGLIPFLKVIESTVKSCSQNGIRGSSATVGVQFWHYEIEDLLMLKNNKGNEEQRCRKLDFSVGFSRIFYERLISDDFITLFSPHEAIGLYDAFGTPEFDDLYRKYEKDENLKFKKKIKAKKLIEIFLRERLETGRWYIFHADHVNTHSSFIETIYISNLCHEITHVTKPLNHIDDPEGEIGVCVLSAINILEIKDFNELESVCDIIVRLLDAVIDHQEYPVKAAENFARNRRSLGVGITNLAAFLASHKLRYEDKKSLVLIDEWMEAIQYNLLKASCNLAKEKGKCNKFHLTKYAKGILNIDTYCKKVDELVKRDYSFNWDALRADILLYGLRNSTLTAQMPVESSSLVQNSTNGIEAPRSLLSIKKSKKGNLKQLVPNFEKYGEYYTTAYSMQNNTSIINISAIIQKYFCMAISTNFYYNYKQYEGGEIPMSVLIKDQLYMYQMGLKCGYYLNSNDGYVDAIEEDSGCESGACKL